MQVDCYNDVHFTRGEIPLPLNLPFTLGHEPAGKIVKLEKMLPLEKKEILLECLFCKKHVAGVNGIFEEEERSANSNKEQE